MDKTFFQPLKALPCLQASPEAADLYRAIHEGNLNTVQDIWVRMQAHGNLLSSLAPWKALWHAAYRQNVEILVWLLQQDFPLDSSSFKEALPNEERDLVGILSTVYGNTIPDQVCNALIERKYKINDVDLMRRLLGKGSRADLLVYAVSQGYFLTADLYSREIIDTFFTAQNIRKIKHYPENGLYHLASALINFKAVDQLWELRNGKHGEELLLAFSGFGLGETLTVWGRHLQQARQQGWLEGVEFFEDILGIKRKNKLKRKRRLEEEEGALEEDIEMGSPSDEDLH
jgi:hypothetical protein